VLDNPDLYYSYYDKQTNTSTGYDDLIGFIEFINAVSDQEFPEAILQVFEVDSYLDYYATIILMGHSDVMTYYHNSFILHNPETGRWEVIPWDNGGAFGTFDLPIDHGTPRHVLLTRILDVPEYRLYYGRFLVEAMADAFTPEHIAEMTEGYRQQIDLDIQCDTWHRYWFAREFDPDRSQFVESRTAYLQSVVYSYTEGLTLPLTLDLTDTGDQLVLRNHGLLDWDVGGMTVQSQEWAWVLPKGTSVPAGGELVLWNALSEQGLLPSAIAPSTLDTLALLDKPVHRARPVAQWTRPTLWQHPVPPAE